MSSELSIELLDCEHEKLFLLLLDIKLIFLDDLGEQVIRFLVDERLRPWNIDQWDLDGSEVALQDLRHLHVYRLFLATYILVATLFTFVDLVAVAFEHG